ncbi:NUDIX hydrolase [Actinophytocola sp.]|uniref:NUDIX hydrolase n=1 Tax=Actinophytocola sp. TaxID=1872138 RepID=UPI00389AD668
MTSEDGWTIPTVAVAVDLAILTVQSGQLQILLVRRGIEPFLGTWALPGGFLASEDEDIDTAAARELAEETGLAVERLHLEQLRTYGAPDRDPRRRVVTVCYLALVPDLPLPAAGGDAQAAEWKPVDKILRTRRPLAFDHKKIVGDAVERARSKLEYTNLATAFCPPVFTVTELRNVYEIVWGQQLDPRNFHRKVTSVENFLDPTGEQSIKNGGRPAMLYRRGSATVLYPPILRG